MKEVTKFKDFGAALLTEFGSMLEEERLADLSLRLSGTKDHLPQVQEPPVKCHRLLLSAVSEHLSSLLKEHEDGLPQEDTIEILIICDDVTTQVLRRAIRVLYRLEDSDSIDQNVLDCLCLLGVDTSAFITNRRPNDNSDHSVIDLPDKGKRKLFQCPSESCPRSFPTKRRLELHRQQVHGLRLAPLTRQELTCDVCQHLAKTRPALEAHKRAHSEEKPFKCALCPSQFSDEKYLAQHSVTHNAQKAFKCHLCPRSYQSLQSLSQHKQTHSTDSQVTCEECLKVFRARRYLYQHMKKKHSSKTSHDCSICQKTLSGKEELKCHMRVHTGERPLVCTVCNATFRNRSTFNNHRKMHLGLRKHACAQCDKSFIQQGDLKKHMRRHTGQKPYSCGECGKSFARSDYVTKHLRSHRRRAKADLEASDDLSSTLLTEGILAEAVQLDALQPGETIELVLESSA